MMKEIMTPRHPKSNGKGLRMMKEIMTPIHPKWDEFTERLEGPNGCNFHDVGGDDGADLRWNCAGGTDKSKAKEILVDMGFDPDAIAKSCEYFENHGGYCDCEILFNVAEGIDEQIEAAALAAENESLRADIERLEVANANNLEAWGQNVAGLQRQIERLKAENESRRPA